MVTHSLSRSFDRSKFINLNNLLFEKIKFQFHEFEFHEFQFKEFHQHLFGVMVNVLLFCLSAGFIFFSLNRKAIEIPKGAPMGTTIAVFSMAMNLFGFLGSLAARKLYF